MKMAFHGSVFCVAMMLLLVVSMSQFLSDGGKRKGGPLGLRKLHPFLRSPAEDSESDEDTGTRWAVLVAGSNGWTNYRHQADVCHAYQLLKKGGLKDENIIVMMYDDIAKNSQNPRPGIIINHPQGRDVYAGVPKDYTGDHVNAENLFAVILGDKKSVKGGSGKVVNSTRNDRIFIYYSDHGGPGVLGMPNSAYVYAKDFVDVLKKKHASHTYKEMVIYVEACESGSIFEGLMPNDMNIYVSTAANGHENSYASYCPESPDGVEDLPCLGDLYSVAWLEDSESHNLKKETIQQQYEKVKKRTSLSHVMEYGDPNIHSEKLYLYQGFNPNSVNLPPYNKHLDANEHSVDQRSAGVYFLWEKYKRMEDNSTEKEELLEEIRGLILHRVHLDGSMKIIEAFLFGPGSFPSVFNFVREPGLPIVDNWDCLKSMVRIFEANCGSLTQYGMKHMRAFANICNNGVSEASMESACKVACKARNLGNWNPSIRHVSA